MNPLRAIQALLNRLLPFTRPGTPLLQDLIHTACLVAFLYYAPQIFESDRGNSRQYGSGAQQATTGGGGLDDHDNAVADPDALQDDFLAAEDAADVDAEDAAAEAAVHGGWAGAANGNQARVDDELDDEHAAGPANINHNGNHNDNDNDNNPAAAAARASRQVGAKKARSIARRDQRRAYHEFMRAQGEAQRARDAEGAEEREAEVYEEKRRRAVAEAALEEKARREREERRERERRAREDETRAQREAVRLVRDGLERRGVVRVEDVAGRVGKSGGVEGREWLERLLRAEGVVGRGRSGDGFFRFVTASGWVVKVGHADIEAAWKRAAEKGTVKITYTDLGEALEEVVLGSAR
ncbi:uncharacterized protein J3D65DRAFT_630951 [Phyllosticta citribraziliensis]|uniref:Uncharacterized protein n=1 Tax=Phyllosticta citribraziliensis TaxID=989973 RepID=A0ABR1LJI2_9PEZI